MSELFEIVLAHPFRIFFFGVMGIGGLAYLRRHFAHDPRYRDITQPPEDFSWRTSGKLYRRILILCAAGLGLGLTAVPDALGIDDPTNYLVALTILIAGALLPDVLSRKRDDDLSFVEEVFADYKLSDRAKKALVVLVALVPFLFFMNDTISGVIESPEEDSRLQEPCDEAKEEGRPCTVISALGGLDHLAKAIESARANDDEGWHREWRAFTAQVSNINLDAFTHEKKPEDLRVIVAMTTKLLEQNAKDELALELRGNAFWDLGEYSAAQDDDDRLSELQEERKIAVSGG